MKQTLALLLVLTISFSATAQSRGTSPGKIAIISLIGDVMTIDTYRRRVGTAVDANHQEVIPIATPVFDNTAISAAAEAVYSQLAPGSSVATLAIPAPGSKLDPALLIVNGAVSQSNALLISKMVQPTE